MKSKNVEKLIHKYLENYCKIPITADKLRKLKYDDMEPGRPYSQEDFYGENLPVYNELITIYHECSDLYDEFLKVKDAYIELEEQLKQLQEENKKLKENNKTE